MSYFDEEVAKTVAVMQAMAGDAELQRAVKGSRDAGVP